MNPFRSLGLRDYLLWGGSLALILVSHLLFGGGSLLSLIASLIGVTSLIFSAKGHPIGQLLMILFSLLYGIISWSFAYYGEMITYLGMTMPMALFSLIAWLKNPYAKSSPTVKVNRLRAAEWILLLPMTAAVTAVFYFILAFFDTANLLPSTLSVTTSFLAVWLTFRRSPYYAIAYAANDIVLILLWILASIQDITYLSVTVCFAVFLVNDLYGFFSWKHLEREQADGHPDS